MDRQEMLTALKQAQGFIGNRAKMAGVGDGNMLLLSWYKALDLAIYELEAREPVAPTKGEDDSWICGACGEGEVGCDVYDETGIESVKNDYCPICGRAVKWDG